MLRDLLGLSKEPIETEISEAAEKYSEEKQSDMDAANQKAEHIRTDIIEEFEKTKQDLEELKGFEDSKNRQVVDDVVDNILTDRIELIEEFSFPENPQKLYEELDDFIEDFQTLTQKESAVLEEAYLQKQISRAIGGLESQRERLEGFLESEYTALTNYKEIKDLLNRRENILNKIDNVRQKIEQLEVEKLESKISDIENKITELENSPEWNEFEQLQEDVKQKKSEREKLISNLKTSLSKMERGLKKLIYRAQNNDLSVNKIDVLEKLRDKKIDYILRNPEKTVAALEEARESLPEDLLNSRQQKKFLKAIEEVEDLQEIAVRIESIKYEVEELEQQIENHSVIQEKSKLESDKKAIETRLEEERDEKQNLEKRVENYQSEIQETSNKIREILEESFKRDIKIS